MFKVFVSRRIFKTPLKCCNKYTQLMAYFPGFDGLLQCLSVVHEAVASSSTTKLAGMGWVCGWMQLPTASSDATGLVLCPISPPLKRYTSGYLLHGLKHMRSSQMCTMRTVRFVRIRCHHASKKSTRGAAIPGYTSGVAKTNRKTPQARTASRAVGSVAF